MQKKKVPLFVLTMSTRFLVAKDRVVESARFGLEFGLDRSRRCTLKAKLREKLVAPVPTKVSLFGCSMVLSLEREKVVVPVASFLATLSAFRCIAREEFRLPMMLLTPSLKMVPLSSRRALLQRAALVMKPPQWSVVRRVLLFRQSLLSKMTALPALRIPFLLLA